MPARINNTLTIIKMKKNPINYNKIKNKTTHHKEKCKQTNLSKCKENKPTILRVFNTKRKKDKYNIQKGNNINKQGGR